MDLFDHGVSESILRQEQAREIKVRTFVDAQKLAEQADSLLKQLHRNALGDAGNRQGSMHGSLKSFDNTQVSPFRPQSTQLHAERHFTTSVEEKKEGRQAFEEALLESPILEQMGQADEQE